MRIFSNIASLLLALAIGINSFGQTQSPSSEYIFQPSESQGTPEYVDVSSRAIWYVINLDSVSGLVSVNFYTDSKEDKMSGWAAELARERYLERFSSIYLRLAKNIACSPTISELLYPFHFYF